MKLSETMVHVLLLLLLSAVTAIKGSFDQFEKCAGQDSIVLQSDADIGGESNGWFVYSGSLIFCCAGLPYAVTCSEMMIGYCDCPGTVTDNTSTVEGMVQIVCYARTCTSQVLATPILNGEQVDAGPTAMCWLPENATLKEQGYTNNVTVSGRDFCRANHGMEPFVPPPPEASPENTGTFELIVDQDTGLSSTGIVPVHMVMIPTTSRTIMWTRGQQPNWPAQPRTEFAVSVVYDWATGKYWPVHIDSNPFCSGVGFSANGNVLAFGGEELDAPWSTNWQPTLVVDGRNKIREFDIHTSEWTTLKDELPGNHWYPTQVLLPDGRVLNQGGYKSMVGPQNEMFEIFDSNVNELIKYFNSTPFTENRSFMNLYPFFSYLPYTDPEFPDDYYLFMDCCNHAEMHTISKNNDLTQKAVLPQMGGDSEDYCAAFSATGFARFLAFKPPYDKPEYVAFGGIYNSTADVLAGKCWTDIKGSDKSFRIGVSPVDLINGKNNWEMETMPFKRVGGLAVLLPNGEVLIMNGAESGSGNDYLGTPVRTAVMYDPDAPAGERYRTLATSPYKRLYHNVAILLPTGNVLVAGGEQGHAFSSTEGPWCGTTLDYTFEAEIYKPPYVFMPELRPTILNIEGDSSEYRFGDIIRVHYEGPVVTSATITSPGAVTHGTDMHSRTAYLEIVVDDTRRDLRRPKGNGWGSMQSSSRINGHSEQQVDDDGEGTSSSSSSIVSYVDLVLPSRHHRVTAPGWHMLFLLHEKSPSHEAIWIKLVDDLVKAADQ